jgi:hypothetical protein
MFHGAGVVATTKVEEACKGVHVAIMVGGFPRKEGMERKDVMTKNVSIYKAQASALEEHADKDCKVRWWNNENAFAGLLGRLRICGLLHTSSACIYTEQASIFCCLDFWGSKTGNNDMTGVAPLILVKHSGREVWLFCGSE